MLEELLKADTDFFLAVHHFRNGFLDFIMPVITNRWIWIPLYALYAGALLKLYGKNFWIIAVSIGLMIVLTDQGANLFKNGVKRPRPCHNVELLKNNQVVSPENCGGPYGFFSAHASNSMAFSVLVILLIRRKKRESWKPSLWLLGWAFCLMWSRVYLGVHYPGDVLSGALYGTILSLIVYYCLSRFYLAPRNA